MYMSNTPTYTGKGSLVCVHYQDIIMAMIWLVEIFTKAEDVSTANYIKWHNAIVIELFNG